MTGRWFSPGTDRHEITEISLKVTLNTINQTKPRDQCAKYGFIRGVTSADVMYYIIRHYRLRFIFNVLSADMTPPPPTPNHRIEIGGTRIRIQPANFLKLELNTNRSINQSINQSKQ